MTPEELKDMKDRIAKAERLQGECDRYRRLVETVAVAEEDPDDLEVYVRGGDLSLTIEEKRELLTAIRLSLADMASDANHRFEQV